MRQRFMALIIAGLLVLLALPATTTAAECQFILGFATLKALIDAAEGPDKVGDCLENQRFNPENGDALQQTTGGLLVWRKADNWTAFTDGYRTWINGPYGLQARLNTETFDWEVPEAPPVISIDQLKNAEYQIGGPGKVKLTDGNYRSPGSPGESEQWIEVGLGSVLFGDLNGDGANDAAVILVSSGGGSGTYFDLAAVINEQGQPRHVGTALTLSSSGGGRSFRIESLEIQVGRIVVRILMLGLSSSGFIPTDEVIRTYRLEGNKFWLAEEVKVIPS